MIHVIATIQLQPGARDEFLGHFREVVPLVHQEEGCLEYGPAVDFATNIPVQVGPRPDVVTVVEKWESIEALEAHLIAPHMLAYREQVKPLVVGTTVDMNVSSVPPGSLVIYFIDNAGRIRWRTVAFRSR